MLTCYQSELNLSSLTAGYTLDVKTGKTYLLRIINAALNDELFFKIAGHNLTVVEADAAYTKPFEIDTIFLSPGQTTNVLLKANQPKGKYLIAITPFMDTPAIGYDNHSSFATLRYKNTPPNPKITLTKIPPQNDTPTTRSFLDSLRSLNSNQYPARVPLNLDHSLLFTIAVGINPCETCIGRSKLVADINNVSFVLPSIALLQAHYYNIGGVFTDDFPGHPPFSFNYTGPSLLNFQTNNGTRLYRLGYNSNVQIVLQGTTVIAPENHPTHLHGFNFFVVGKGMGNFDPVEDPKWFNLVDPVERNTIGVPTAGWVAIRFTADNPGENSTSIVSHLSVSFFLFVNFYISPIISQFLLHGSFVVGYT